MLFMFHRAVTLLANVFTPLESDLISIYFCTAIKHPQGKQEPFLSLPIISKSLLCLWSLMDYILFGSLFSSREVCPQTCLDWREACGHYIVQVSSFIPVFISSKLHCLYFALIFMTMIKMRFALIKFFTINKYFSKSSSLDELPGSLIDLWFAFGAFTAMG